MIACYRRMPHFISNNVRTFFCDTSKAAPLDAKWLEDVVKHHKNGRTTNGSKYRTVRLRDNVRVFLITDPKIEKKEMVFGSIKIGVGSADDPADCLGLAHLLEHVLTHIAELKNVGRLQLAETFSHQTVYTFFPTTANYAEALVALSNLLFSESDLQSLNSEPIKIMKSECETVDAEWHEKCNDVTNMNKITEILRVKGMDTHTFGWGNEKTQQRTDDNQKMEYLNQLRRRYRERPVDVFIYSKDELKMETILKALNADDFLQKGQAMEGQPIDWKTRHQTANDLNKHLFVVKSDYDWQQLVIVFPLNEHISHKHMKTLDFISEMIASTADGSLGRRLIMSNYATLCNAVYGLNLYAVFVRLTNEGLDQIQMVEKIVQNYLQFLNHNWETLDEFEYRKQWTDKALKELEGKTTDQYIHYIGSNYDIKTDEFDENHLIQTLDRDKAQKFISEHIVNNETIVRMIHSRDPEGVVKTLVKRFGWLLPEQCTSLKDMKEQKDDIYNTQFYTIDESKLFAYIKVLHTPFTLPDLRQIPVEGHISLEEALIIKPEDTSYQNLLITHLDLECARFWSPFDKGFFNGSYQPPFCVPRVDEVVKFLNDSKNRKMKKEPFQLSRHRLMCEQSQMMSESLPLAQSLMETAVGNVLIERGKRQPIPMQYKALSTMSLTKYNRNAAALKEIPDFKKICEEGLKLVNNDDPSGATCLIESINRNERTTVTSLFCVTQKDKSMEPYMLHYLARCCLDIRRKQNFYNIICDRVQLCGLIRGLLIRIVSVESNKNHTNDKIINLLDETMERTLPHKIEEAKAWNNLKPLHEHMLKRRFLVQIKGHTSYRGNEPSFKTQFDAWYKKHEPTFRKIM